MSVTEGKGGVLSATTSAQQELIVPAPANGTAQKSAMTMKVWNTGSETLYIIVNAETSDYVEASAVPIPAGDSFWFVGQPMKKFVYAVISTGTGTTFNYGAY